MEKNEATILQVYQTLRASVSAFDQILVTLITQGNAFVAIILAYSLSYVADHRRFGAAIDFLALGLSLFLFLANVLYRNLLIRTTTMAADIEAKELSFLRPYLLTTELNKVELSVARGSSLLYLLLPILLMAASILLGGYCLWGDKYPHRLPEMATYVSLCGIVLIGSWAVYKLWLQNIAVPAGEPAQAQADRHIEALPGGSRYWDLVMASFVTVLLVSNTMSQKIFQLGPVSLPAGDILFPISYIFGDILTEVWGYDRARRAIWFGFAAEALMSIVFWIGVILPPAPGWADQQAFQTTLGQVPRIVAASLVAYWFGEFANSYVLAKMKILTRGRWLWTRTVGSTVVGQALDTSLFVTLAFFGKIPNDLILRTMISLYFFKVAYEIVATPVTYWVVAFLKRKEGNIEHFDHGTNFNPFAISRRERQ